MDRRLTRRKVLHVAGISFMGSLAGCGSIRSRSNPTVDSSLGTTAYDPVLGGQPTVDDGVPAVWGLLVSHPDAAQKLIDWNALGSSASSVEPGAEFRSFDPDKQLLSVVIGVLPTGYGLTGYTRDSDSALEDLLDDFRERPTIDDGQLRLEVAPFQAFSPDPGTPDNHYDYTFTLWNLNGHDRPDEIFVNLNDA